jgi:Uncharacterized conserved protein
MTSKVAVASSDGKVINQHFGRSRHFLIFEIDDQGEYRFLESRSNDPPCGISEHFEDDMQRTVDLLSDCSIVLVSRIGPAAKQSLSVKNIFAYAVPDQIDRALMKLADYERKHKNKKYLGV